MAQENMTPTKSSTFAWALYDWASSPVPTLHATFIFSVYFATTVMPEGGSAAWAWMTSAAALSVAIMAPLAGRIADRFAASKAMLGLVTVGGVIATASLWIIEPDRSFAMTALILSAISIFMMEISFVFYNALLPSVAKPQSYGRVSGMAWGLGYAGAIVALAIVLMIFVMPEQAPFGLDKAAAEHVRITMVFAAIWLAIFALPLFIKIPPAPRPTTQRPLFAELKASLKTAMAIPGMVRFLVARMLFADGLITLFAFGGIYAAKIFGFTQTMVLVFGIVLNITAGLGAALCGRLDDRYGSVAVIRVSLIALIGLGTMAILAPNETVFWIAGALLGIFIGPLQSSSRVYVAHKAPPQDRASMFGLMMFSGKATSFVGPLGYGLLVTASGTDRVGMSIVIVLLIAGLALMPKR